MQSLTLGLAQLELRLRTVLGKPPASSISCQPSLKDMGGKNPTGWYASNAPSVEVNLLRNLHTLKMFPFFPLCFSSR